MLERMAFSSQSVLEETPAETFRLAEVFKEMTVAISIERY